MRHPVLVPPPTKGAQRRAFKRKVLIALQILIGLAMIAGLLFII